LIFRKKKYRFNPSTLSYEEIVVSRRHRIKVYGIFFTLFLIVSFVSGGILSAWFGPAETRLLEARENFLAGQLELLFDRTLSAAGVLHNTYFKRDNAYRAMLEIDSFPVSQRIAGTGGHLPAWFAGHDENLHYNLNQLINTLQVQLEVQSQSYTTILHKARAYSDSLTHIPAIQPVALNDLIMISSDFGVRSDPFLFESRVHNGLDFVASIGTPVYATGSGTVTFLQLSRTGYGNEIVIDHSWGFSSRYAHLDEILVNQGQKVKRGQLIGKVGNTGRATGPHLHYEVRFRQRPVDPSFYFDTSLSVPEYRQILGDAITSTN